MSVTALVAAAILVGGSLSGFLLRQHRMARLAAYRFPEHIQRRVAATYPHLGPVEIERVMRGLRQFFAVAQAARGRRVAMPSQAVDTAWHEFILSTRAYQDFCRLVLGRFLHHTPAEAMVTATHAQEGLRRTWRLACRDEGIESKSPSRLPLLFALDAQLAIPGGFTYALNCRWDERRQHDGGGGAVYCASDIGSCSGGGGCGGDSDGNGDGGGCGGDSDGNGDGGGCGGD